jgi:hypothetical protein
VSREDGVALIESVNDRFPDAVRLARVASLAVRIEPHLLRRLRLRLVREADVGAEADLWFSQLVESRGVDAIVLQHDVAAILRDELTGHPRLDEIVAILVDAHRGEPSTIMLEEKVNALAVQRGAAAIDQIDRELRAAIVAMRESDTRAREIARWFLRAFPRLHPVVQQCPNAIGLLLSASMLLGRRSTEEVRETSASLAGLGWMLPSGALDARVEIGVERLFDAVRFVAIDSAADAPSGGSVPTVSIPASEPRLVEITWTIEGRSEQRVVEAIPGAAVTLGSNATNVRIVTLAGDEYDVLSAAGAEPVTADAPFDLTPYLRFLRSCLPVMTNTEPRVFGMAVQVHRDYLMTAREPFGAGNLVGVVTGPSSAAVHRVVPVPEDEDHGLVAVESGPGPYGPIPLSSAPFTAVESAQQGVLERVRERAVVFGHDGQRIRGVEGEAEIDDLTGRSFRVSVPQAQSWFTSLAGGPVIIGERVRGIVTSIDLPPDGGAAMLTVAGAEVIVSVLERVIAQEKAELVPPDPPSWVPDVCVELRAEGIEPVIGLVVADRLIVSTATSLRGAATVTALIRNAPIEARVLGGGEGPLVFLGVASHDAFTTRAPLIRSSTRVRRPDDPPDPRDAMLVFVREGLRTLPVVDAKSAGVINARDPSGYRFKVTVGDVGMLLETHIPILVWGDYVAGLAFPGPEIPGQHIPQDTREFMSVNVLKESIESATGALEKLDAEAQPDAPPKKPFRAWLSSVSGDLQGDITGVVEQVKRHGGVVGRLDVEGDFLPPERRQAIERAIGQSDLFILIVGSHPVTMKGLEKSVAEFEYEVARRAGVSMLVFMSEDDRAVTDSELRAWRQALKKEHVVSLFDGSRLSLHVAAGLARWMETREDRDAEQQANAAVSNAEAAVGPSGYHFAEVVVCGPPNSGTDVIVRNLPGVVVERDDAPTRSVLWVERSPAAPELHAGVAFVAAPSDENWPLGLNVKGAALVIVAVAVETELLGLAARYVSRVRAAHASVPIVIALSHFDVTPGDLQKLVASLSDNPEVDRVFTLPGHNGEYFNDLIAGTVSGIDWSRQATMSRDEFERAMRQGTAVFADVNTRPGLLRKWSKRTERLIISIIERARHETQGLPAIPLDELIKDLSNRASSGSEVRASVDALVDEGIVTLATKSGTPILVLHSALETAPEPTVPDEAKTILRAQWTGTGRDVFVDVLVHYAFVMSTEVEAAWQRSLTRGVARIGNDPTLYLTVVERGEITELSLALLDRTRSADDKQLAKQSRDLLESLLTGNASLSFDDGWS